MKEIAQGFLIVGGGMGLLGAVPAAIYGWFFRRDFGGALATDDYLILYGPAICIAALVIGIFWRKVGTKRAPRGKFSLLDGGGADAGGGGDSGVSD